MKKLAIIAVVAFVMTGSVLAQVGEIPSSVMIGGGTPSNTLSQLAAFLANQLANNRDIKNVSDSRVAVASFVSLSKLDEADKLGISLAENLMHEMYVRGFGVVDFKTMDNLRVRQQGDFVFSRDVGDLKRQYNVHYYLSGTITRNSDGAVVNARLIQADNSLIVSTAQGFIPNNALSRLLGEESRAITDKVIIERPRIPSVRNNTVLIR